jgi:hypothetical protein
VDCRSDTFEGPSAIFLIEQHRSARSYARFRVVLTSGNVQVRAAVGPCTARLRQQMRGWSVTRRPFESSGRSVRLYLV